MDRLPKKPLSEKDAWYRERDRKRAAKAATTGAGAAPAAEAEAEPPPLPPVRFTTPTRTPYAPDRAVRTRRERERMVGLSCPECESFNKWYAGFTGRTVEQVERHSRHRHLYKPAAPSTPPGLWDVWSLGQDSPIASQFAGNQVLDRAAAASAQDAGFPDVAKAFVDGKGRERALAQLVNALLSEKEGWPFERVYQLALALQAASRAVRAMQGRAPPEIEGLDEAIVLASEIIEEHKEKEEEKGAGAEAPAAPVPIVRSESPDVLAEAPWRRPERRTARDWMREESAAAAPTQAPEDFAAPTQVPTPPESPDLLATPPQESRVANLCVRCGKLRFTN
jgi:hypothetical protein